VLRELLRDPFPKLPGGRSHRNRDNSDRNSNSPERWHSTALRTTPQQGGLFTLVSRVACGAVNASLGVSSSSGAAPRAATPVRLHRQNHRIGSGHNRRRVNHKQNLYLVRSFSKLRPRVYAKRAGPRDSAAKEPVGMGCQIRNSRCAGTVTRSRARNALAGQIKNSKAGVLGWHGAKIQQSSNTPGFLRRSASTRMVLSPSWAKSNGQIGGCRSFAFSREGRWSPGMT